MKPLCGIAVAAACWCAVIHSATAACADWSPEATVTVEDPSGRVPLMLGRLRGIRLNYFVTNPTTHNRSLFYVTHDFASRVEVRDEHDRPVDVGRATWLDLEHHGRTTRFAMSAGSRASLTIRPYWLNLPAGGVYRIRAGFWYQGFDPSYTPGSPTPTGSPPICEAWSEWTTFEVYPVDTLPGPLATVLSRHRIGNFLRMGWSGLLWTDLSTGKIYWLTGVGPEEDRRLEMIPLGKSAERKTGGLHDVDARIDAAGIAHVIFPVAGGKTHYAKIGKEGRFLERKDYPGKKKLAGPRERVEVVDKSTHLAP